MEIPKRFKLFSTTIKVEWNDKRLDDLRAFGISEYGKSLITLSSKDGAEDLSNDKIMDTFYHERTHAILSAMGENELNKNEQFVDIFSKLLRQSIETAEY